MTVRRFSRTFPLLAALLLGAACAVLVACGSSGSDAHLIPDDQAASMIDQLDTIQSAVSKGRCDGVDNDVAALQTQINGLSHQVDARLRNRLQEGVNNLADIAPDECFAQRDRQTTTQTQTTETQTTTTETQTTDTTPTQTVPTTPETTPTTPDTTPTVPPDTTPVTPPGGATIPGTGGAGGTDGTGDGGTGGASPVTP
jgi:hypothetical protein